MWGVRWSVQVSVGVHRCAWVGVGVYARVCADVHGCAWVCAGVCKCTYMYVGGCGCEWVGAEVHRCLQVCVLEKFSEYLLETRVNTSVDFNTYPIRIFFSK